MQMNCESVYGDTSGELCDSPLMLCVNGLGRWRQVNLAWHRHLISKALDWLYVCESRLEAVEDVRSKLKCYRGWLPATSSAIRPVSEIKRIGFSIVPELRNLPVICGVDQNS